MGFLGYQLRRSKPIIADEFNLPGDVVIDLPLLLGASCFGIGWGVAGLCPGPALFRAAVGSPAVALFWMPAFFAGSYLGSEVQDHSIIDIPFNNMFWSEQYMYSHGNIKSDSCFSFLWL